MTNPLRHQIQQQIPKVNICVEVWKFVDIYRQKVNKMQRELNELTAGKKTNALIRPISSVLLVQAYITDVIQLCL